MQRLAAFAALLLVATAARAVELQPGDIIAVEAVRQRLLRIDPETGAQQEIPAMGKLVGAWGVAIDARDQILLTVPGFLGGVPQRILRVDPATGSSSILTSGGLLRGPLGIVVEGDGRIAVSDYSGSTGRGSIVRVDPATGAQTLVSAGGELFFASGLSLLPDGDFLVAGTAAGGVPPGVILRVDATTSEQHVIAKPTLSNPVPVVATPDGEAYFGTRTPGLVVRVGLATGEQTLVAEIGDVWAMAFEPSGTLVLGVQTIGSQIVRVDPRTGATEEIAGLVASFVTGLAVVPFRLLEVEIDIRPASASNPINPAARGVVPLALLGSEELDVASVDPESLAFGPAGAAPVRAGALGDLNADGLPDLLLHFRIAATGIQAGDTETCLTGATLEGRPIEGCDAIRTAGLSSWRARWTAAGR